MSRRNIRRGRVDASPEPTTSHSGATVTPLVLEAAQRGTEIAAEVVALRVVQSTSKQYASVFRFITTYCAEKYPDAVDDSGKLILPMNITLLKAFLGDMATDRSNGTVKATSTVTTYCTVLKHFYTEAGISINAELTDFFKQFHQGYKRKVAHKKNIGLMKNFEGKVGVTYVVYTALAKNALFAATLRTRFSSLVHAFLILCWNLFSRSCPVAELRTTHFSWENDALVIDMSKHKADQAGENIKPKHIYANPYCPEVCPILQLYE